MTGLWGIKYTFNCSNRKKTYEGNKNNLVSYLVLEILRLMPEFKIYLNNW